LVQEKEDPKLVVIVDSREFRSELPSLLHRRGFEIVPAMITIGDYILTPQICVERKSISDLIGSLQSGRLFNQCQQMTRYYISVVLLIEFDQNRPFHLLGRYVMTREYEMSSTELIQKLQILTIHFPRLRIIWSPTPYATAQIFEDLKKNKENPSIEVASQIGTDEGGNEFSEASDKYNNEIYDFLLKLPGVNSKNIHNLMKKGKSLKNLITLKEPELAVILGNSKDAKILYDILHNCIKPKQEKQRKAPSLAQKHFRKM
jgi:DNA excision repair protein ERCC-4